MKTLIHSLALALISFTLSALPIQEARAQAVTTERESLVQDENGNQPNVVKGPQSEDESAVGVYYDSEGYAVKAHRIQTDDAKRYFQNNDFLTFALLLAIGVFAGTMWRYTTMAWDMRIAMAAGITMVGATVTALMTARKNIDAKEYKVIVREDGTVVNMQEDAIRKQAESYRELEKLSGIKWKIETAGAVAFTAAAGTAMWAQSVVNQAAATCAAAMSSSPTCGPAAAALAKIQTTVNTVLTGTSMGDWTAIQTDNAALVAALPACPGAAAACQGHFHVLSTQFTATATPIGTVSVPGSTPTLEAPGMESFVSSLVKESLKKEQVVALWDNDLEENRVYEKLFSRKIGIEDYAAFGDYLKEYESQRAKDFEHHNASVAIDELPLYFQKGKNIFDSKLKSQLDHQQNTIAKMLKEIFISEVHAFGMQELGLAGGAALAFWSVYRKTGSWFDRQMAVPQRRAVIYGAAAGISAACALLSKKIEGVMGENAKKLEDLLAKMGRLQNMKTAHTGNTTVRPNMYNPLAPRNISAPTMAPEGEKFPCNRPTQDGRCPSVEAEISSVDAFGDMGAPVANIASLTGRVADGMMGSDQLSSGVLSDVDKLAAQQGVANSFRDQARDRLNKLAEMRGEKPTDFEKLSNRFLDDLKSATIRSLKDSDPKAVGGMFASIGGGLPIPPPKQASDLTEEDLGDGLQEEKAVAEKDEKNGDEMVFDFFGEDEFSYNPNLDNAIVGADGLIRDIEGGDESTDDIVNNRDVSLFQIITVRYFKSGFPRLFELNE